MDGVRKELGEIREELDEHLEALNQNTAEISAAHEYVSELDMKLEKLAERVDALQALMLAQTPAPKQVRLTPKEESIMRVLQYSSEPLTSHEIGKRLGLTADMAAQSVYCLKQKNIPVLAQTMGEQTYYALDAKYLQHVQRV
jgi:hypothetical protein